MPTLCLVGFTVDVDAVFLTTWGLPVLHLFSLYSTYNLSFSPATLVIVSFTHKLIYLSIYSNKSPVLIFSGDRKLIARKKLLQYIWSISNNNVSKNKIIVLDEDNQFQ